MSKKTIYKFGLQHRRDDCDVVAIRVSSKDYSLYLLTSSYETSIRTLFIFQNLIGYSSTPY